MENNLKLVCPKCGTPHQPHSPHTMDADGFERCEIRTVMEDRGWCYECSFWQNMYDKHKDDPEFDIVQLIGLPPIVHTLLLLISSKT